MRKPVFILTAFFILIFTFIDATAQNVVFNQNDQVVMKTGISFIWIRSNPNSDCACVVYGVRSNKIVLRILDAAPTSDGIQNWWHVSTTTRPIKEGWVEENSIRLLKRAPVATSTPAFSSTPLAKQFKTNAVQIREGVSFIWVRSAPSSSASILQTINFSRPTSQTQCLGLATVGTVVHWDGKQWWQMLAPATTARSDIQAGWVEQNSLVDCNPDVPTSNVTATPPLSASSFMTPFPTISTYAAYQSYENGIMIWRQDNQSVYVLSNHGGFLVYLVDNYAGLAAPTDVPPSGRYTPVNAFGKVWNGAMFRDTSVRDLLGWATAPEIGYTATISGYSNGCYGKCDTRTTISLPNGHSAELSTAFFSWKYN